MALGNHDFDLGPDVTARFIGRFAPTIPFLYFPQISGFTLVYDPAAPA